MAAHVSVAIAAASESDSSGFVSSIKSRSDSSASSSKFSFSSTPLLWSSCSKWLKKCALCDTPLIELHTHVPVVPHVLASCSAIEFDVSSRLALEEFCAWCLGAIARRQVLAISLQSYHRCLHGLNQCGQVILGLFVQQFEIQLELAPWSNPNHHHHCQ